MALFALICIDKPDSLALRMATREAHLAYLGGKPGVVKVGGPFLDAKGDMAGSLMIVDLADLAAARELSANDPYAKAGLFERVEIRPWRATVGLAP